MSKMSRHSTTPVEVIVMFEPHRLHHDLLHTAYALLVPRSRRRLAAEKPVPVPAGVQPQESEERSVS